MADNDVQTTTSDVPNQLPVGEGQNGTAPVPQTGPPAPQDNLPVSGRPPMPPPQPADPRDDHPAVQSASIMRRIGETIAGGPKIKTTIDPNTGTVTREPVPLSNKDILTGALANILGGLGQMGGAFVASREHRAPPPPQPLPTQVAAQQAAQTSQEDFERQQQTKVQKAKVITANLEAMRAGYAIGKEDDDAKDSYINNHKDDLEQWQKTGAVEASNIPSDQMMKQNFDKTKYIAIPDGRVPVFTPDGKRATNADGVPLSQLTYSVVDGTTQTALTKDKYDQLAKYGLMNAKQGFNLPEGATITSASLAMMNHKLDLIGQTQRELDEVHDAVGGDKVDLAAQIKKNPQVLAAIEKFHNDAANTEPDEQINTMTRVHPQAAGLMRELFGNENLEKFKENRIARQAGEKEKEVTTQKAAAEAATPEGQQKLKNEKLAGEKDQLEIDKLKKDTAGFGAGDTSLTGDAYLNSLPPDSQSLVKELGTGKIALSRLDYLLTRKPEVLEAVSRAYPDFDSSKVQGYTNAVKEYTSTKNGAAGAQLNAGSTALKHMSELKELNTAESRIPGTADYNRYHNKLDTLTGELATFYNLPKTDQSIQHMASTLGAFLNRDASIETQAQSMGDKFDSMEQSWKNAAPSKAYEAPMPYIDSNALRARAKLDPRYAARVNGQPPPPNKQPPAQNFAATSSDGKWGWDGKAWVATGK